MLTASAGSPHYLRSNSLFRKYALEHAERERANVVPSERLGMSNGAGAPEKLSVACHSAELRGHSVEVAKDQYIEVMRITLRMA